MKKNFLVLTVFLLIFFGTMNAVAETLIVLHAGSLTRPLRQAEEVFEKQYKKSIFFDDESGGSVKVVRSISELGKTADIVAVADYSLIPQYLMPTFTKWYVKFATNQLVLAYTSASKYADKINQQNWYNILMKPKVEFGFSNPNLDPCGYRTRLMFNLAEKYYKIPNLATKLITSCSPNNIKSKSVNLIAGLESGELDYAFEYLSVAKQNHLKYLMLPDPINFGEQKYSKFYSQATLTLDSGKKMQGKPIIYGITILKNAPHKELAEKFLAFLLGKEGRKIFEENGQPPIIPQVNVALSQLPSDIAQVISNYDSEK